MADNKELTNAPDVADNGGSAANEPVVSEKGNIEKTGTAKSFGEGYSVGGYMFAARADYERALKEQETINYITANTNFSDTKSILKMYNRAVENSSFKSVIGVAFMKELRDKIAGSGILEEKLIAPIPVQKISGGSGNRMARDEKDAQIKRYREAYENADAGVKIRNIIIAFLAVIIVAMIVITYMSRYSVFTYFTDYKADMENELIDQYEHWQQELEKREAAVKEKEDELGITYDGSIGESITYDENNDDGNSSGDKNNDDGDPSDDKNTGGDDSSGDVGSDAPD